MIVQLTPLQVSAFWDAAKHAIKIANKNVLPADRERFCNNVLANVLSGKAQVWASYDPGDDGDPKFRGIGITIIEEDSLTQEKRLYMHSLYAFRPLENDPVDMLPVLAAFARKEGCSTIYTFTAIEKLQQIYTANGFNQNLQLYTLTV